MEIQQTTIFNNNLNSNSENLSSVFTEGLGFYLIAPASSFEYQIDIYLQVQVSNTTTRQVRLDPLNVSTTQRITLIPQQIVELGLPMRLAILPSKGFFLEIILIKNDCGLCNLENKINANTALLEQIATANSNNGESLLELITQLLQLDTRVFAITQGLNRLLPQTQRQEFTENRSQRLLLDRTFLR